MGTDGRINGRTDGAGQKRDPHNPIDPNNLVTLASWSKVNVSPDTLARAAVQAARFLSQRRGNRPCSLLDAVSV